jgi:hypothetical protein
MQVATTTTIMILCAHTSEILLVCTIKRPANFAQTMVLCCTLSLLGEAFQSVDPKLMFYDKYNSGGIGILSYRPLLL